MIFLLIVSINFLLMRSVYPINKCCDADSLLQKNNSQYFCDSDYDKRLQIFAEEFNYLNFPKQNDTECDDISNGQINRYKLRNSIISNETQLDVNYFPKCCPLNYIYNATVHSCVKTSKKIDASFIKQNFIKVGLPNCRLIEDYPLDSPGNYMFESNFLHLKKYNKTFEYGDYCLDRDENLNLIARGCYQNLDICSKTRCIRKCCPDGQSFVNGKKCRNTYINGLNLEFSDRINNSKLPFAIIHNQQCRLYVLNESRFKFYLDERGDFWIFYNRTNSYKKMDVTQDSYCIEHVVKKNMNDFYFFGCYMERPIAFRFLITKWTNIISCIFVTLTIIVYLILPQLLNLFGKILICYCTAMLSLFSVSTYMQFQKEQTDNICVVMSFILIFTSLCGFSWLNVMCFDIWYTFGKPTTVLSIHQKHKEKKKFGYYCLYSLCLPTLLISIIIATYNMESIPYVVKPIIGTYKCYFEKRSGNYAMFLYFIIPLFIMNFANIILFIKTITYCLKVKGEIHRINENRMSMKNKRKTFVANKEQLSLIVKLSVTMGISFVFEAVSSFFDFSAYPVTKYIEIVWDIFNSFQGLFIFIIFVCKRKIYDLFRNKFSGNKPRKTSLSSTAQMSFSYQSKIKEGNV